MTGRREEHTTLRESALGAQTETLTVKREKMGCQSGRKCYLPSTVTKRHTAPRPAPEAYAVAWRGVECFDCVVSRLASEAR